MPDEETFIIKELQECLMKCKNFWTLYRIISISSCAQSHPSSIAMRYLQRKTIMSDPNWNKGHYYDGAYPKMGMKLARCLTIILLQYLDI